MLPLYRFPEKLQLAVIDGPHAYPFPDLEYYYLYPHLETGALLVLDDIHIRSINNLFQFLRSDAMFRLDEVVGTTAFFTRTDAPAFDPAGDGWSQQGYNGRTLLRYDWRSTLRSVLPRRFLRRLASYRHAGRRGLKKCAIIVTSPNRGERVFYTGVVRGRANLSAGENLWVLAHRKDVNGWWPQGAGPVAVINGCWSVKVDYGGPEDAGHEFEIAAVVVVPELNQSWLEWVECANRAPSFPPVQLPTAPFVLSERFQTVYRAASSSQ